MHERIITGLLLIVAIVHLLPVSGFFGAGQLASLYGITINNSNLEILMRHRAMLFGILALFFAYAAFKPSVQPIAFVAAFISLISFILLSFSIGEFNDSIRRVVMVDIAILACLLIAVILYFTKSDSQ